MNFKTKIQKNIVSIPGWRTNRKIVVIESDDWGSIRMTSKDVYNILLTKGYQVDKSHYNQFDSLENNEDLSMLYEVLTKHKDRNSSHPVFTSVAIVGNPDFEKIKASNYKKYFFEPFTETLKKYPNHEHVYALYQQGIQERLFVPVFHGREHLNVQRWMKELQNGNLSVLDAFGNGVTGLNKGKYGENLPDFQAAFDLDQVSDIEYMKEVLNEGLQWFEKLFGYKSKYFVPTNGPFNNSLEVVLHENGVQYVNTGKKQLEPLGNGQYKTNIRFLGQRNNLNQRYITRNCFFEPSSMEHGLNKDWVSDCLEEIEIAFRWKKPAVISTHRVNYIGFLDEKNRERGLSQLDLLLKKMIERYPDIEFMTSVELGDLISANTKE
ncbi:hypothetical protein MM213_01080 [Belliella sp. R4-6]|uniref:Glycoside hydrolase family 57 N-terminal domain-containing protein n=1 Tax=Belliella alkalica TaxID=1730871 RepID=A0ABS9V765_9BACT|nr:hypothetical protein [Belliella alkalica]MCH7412059.1 hypothetical protein [Belliella alkalica]